MFLFATALELRSAVGFMLVNESVGYIPPHFEQVALAVGCVLLRTPTIVFMAFRRCTPALLWHEALPLSLGVKYLHSAIPYEAMSL